MKTAHLPHVAALTLFAIGCAPAKPELTADQAEAIVAAVRPFEESLSTGSCAPSAEWPSAIKALKPQSVCRRADGVMIRIWTRAAEERGYLVPPAGRHLDTRRGFDPALFHLHESLYWYQIKG